jgi:DNA polymerase III epsilon subunit family exonuclease
MDPNAALNELRPLALADAERGCRWAELFLGLDEWMERGGFLPVDWAHVRDQDKPEEKPKRVPVPGFHNMSLVDLPLVVIDFETTGLDPKKDRIVEYGYAHFDKGVCTGQGGGFINPGVELTEEVQKVHGITNDMVKHAPPFFSALAMLTTVMKNRVPVAYNASFDQSFLINELKSPTVSMYQELPAFRDDTEWIDPLVWVRHFHKFAKGKKLTDMCPRLGVKLDDAHRAASDAKATGEVLMKLVENSKMSEDHMVPLFSLGYAALIEKQQDLAEEQERDYQQWKARQKNG